jgi:hypothetical protein
MIYNVALGVIGTNHGLVNDCNTVYEYFKIVSSCLLGELLLIRRFCDNEMFIFFIMAEAGFAEVARTFLSEKHTPNADCRVSDARPASVAW